MTRPNQTFDWTAWYTKIPGIPLDWGKTASDADAPRRYDIVPPRRSRRRLHLAI